MTLRRWVAGVCGRERLWREFELRARRLQIRVQPGGRGLLSAGHEVAVAVPGLAHIAVSSPGGDLLPVQAGRGEVADRAVAGLVGRDRIESRSEPRLARAGADGERMTQILLRAAQAGNAQMRVQAFADRRPDRVAWPDRQWEWAALRYEDGDFYNTGYLDVDAREKWFS